MTRFKFKKKKFLNMPGAAKPKDKITLAHNRALLCVITHQCCFPKSGKKVLNNIAKQIAVQSG